MEILSSSFTPRRLLITERFFEQMIEPLRAALANRAAPGELLEVRYVPARELSSADLEWADSWLGFDLPAGAIEIGFGKSGLRWIHSASDGVSQFYPAWEAMQNAGTILTNTVGTMPERIAEYVVAAVLGQIVGLPEYREFARQRQWARRLNPTALECAVTVIGTGRVGAMIAQRLRPFVRCVRGLSLSGVAKPEFDAVAQLGSGDYVSDADILVLALPDTPSTRGIVSEQLLGQLAGAIVVNIGRGSTLDAQALHGALESGAVAHAVLDVFEREPLPEDDWRWEHPGVTITPHVSGFTALGDVLADFLANLDALRAGVTPPNLIDLSGEY